MLPSYGFAMAVRPYGRMAVDTQEDALPVRMECGRRTCAGERGPWNLRRPSRKEKRPDIWRAVDRGAKSSGGRRVSKSRRRRNQVIGLLRLARGR